MLRSRILKDMDKLEHSKTEGFYDKDLDLFFNNLNDWSIAKHGVTLTEAGI